MQYSAIVVLHLYFWRLLYPHLPPGRKLWFLWFLVCPGEAFSLLFHPASNTKIQAPLRGHKLSTRLGAFEDLCFTKWYCDKHPCSCWQTSLPIEVLKLVLVGLGWKVCYLGGACIHSSILWVLSEISWTKTEETYSQVGMLALLPSFVIPSTFKKYVNQVVYHKKQCKARIFSGWKRRPADSQLGPTHKMSLSRLAQRSAHKQASIPGVILNPAAVLFSVWRAVFRN